MVHETVGIIDARNAKLLAGSLGEREIFFDHTDSQPVISELVHSEQNRKLGSMYDSWFVSAHWAHPLLRSVIRARDRVSIKELNDSEEIGEEISMVRRVRGVPYQNSCSEGPSLRRATAKLEPRINGTV